MKNKIYVTQPYLPRLEEFTPYLEKIWDNKILTNGGPFHQELELKLCEYLGVKHISLFNNATIALITALQALDIDGEVLTTPFSFVATSHSIIWSKSTPVFVDIDEKTLNIDCSKIENHITKNTKAIMPVHCYGIPCNYKAIETIAEKYRLKVIYDAAHAFGVECDCGSVLNHGDLSILSFHATKIFNTFEGGAIISHTKEMKDKIDKLKNFGIEDEITINAIGLNGKMNEISAAFGLLQLKYIHHVISSRKKIFDYYSKNLDKKYFRQPTNNAEKSNYSYLPVILNSNYPISRDELYEILKEHGIFARKYFYPLISNLPMYSNILSASQMNLPVANEISKKILCLPIYPDLNEKSIDRVLDVLNNPNKFK